MDVRVGSALARARSVTEPGRRSFGRRLVLGFTASAVAVALGFAVLSGVLPGALGPSSSSGDTPATVVRSANLYPLDNAPAAAAAFSGNRVVVLGTVAAIEPARWSSGDRDTGDIYRPVRIDVTEVLRGDVPGTSVTVRSLGGEADGVRMEFFDTVPLADVAVGSRLLLFLGGEPAGDGGPAGFNMAYLVGPDGRATSFPDGQHSIALDDFRTLIEEVGGSGPLTSILKR
jgi:hypothetical protein